MRKAIALLCLFPALAISTSASAGVAYPDPPGGWAYTYSGDGAAPGTNGETEYNSDNGRFDALDGTWDHTNDSDQWNGTYSATDGGVRSQNGYLTIVDRKTSGSNKKLYFAHDIGPVDTAMDTILDTGVTLSFRGRLTVNEDWPTAKGLEIRNSGKGMWGIHQAKIHDPANPNPDDVRGERISFGLVTGTEHANLQGKSGLVMNRGGSITATRNVDTDDPMAPATLRILEMPRDSLTDWHEFWITIVADPRPGDDGGTHRVDIYVDGALTPQTFWVSVSSGLNDYPSLGQGATIWRNYIAMGSSRSGNTGAFDTDFFSWAPGVIAPIPEPATISLLAIALPVLVRRR